MRPSSPSPARPSLRMRLFGSFSHVPRALALLGRVSDSKLWLILPLLFIGSGLPVGIAWVGKLVIDTVVLMHNTPVGAAHDQAAVQLGRLIMLEIGLVMVGLVIERVLAVMRELTGNQLGKAINVMIMEKALTLPLRCFEDHRFYDLLTRARREASSRPLALANDIFQIIRGVITITSYLTILISFSPWIGLGLLAAAIPAFFAETRISDRLFQIRSARAHDLRRTGYIEQLVGSDRHAKEVKLFGLGPLLLRRHRMLTDTHYAQDVKFAHKRVLATIGVSLIPLIAFYGCYLAVALAAAVGKISIGSLGFCIAAFRHVQSSIQATLAALAGMYDNNLYMANLFDFLAIPVEPLPPAIASPRTEKGIRFEQVSFRYPEAKSWAVHNLSFFIADGQAVAIVGENGAGKTTLIKLLTRLYVPTEGKIFLDGRDLNGWDQTELWARIGIIFQDFSRYQFSLRENVGFGNADHLEDFERVNRAIDKGGARDLVERLPAGIDAQLGTWFQDGVELSGGEWQRVALARGFMRDTASILILDEPTAALDAKAEQALFERFRALTRGRTAILISHRFPTVRIADRIFVLQGGRMIEAGSHEELLAANGVYAHLFTLQAEGYR